ncbi:hypothetical protein EZV62_012522 [Acer yangbiense]|uniref:Pentacotripeptide-repeat region of PRORP domain-containing protein n=1 Tax=Acer yangbiense TaxID=1000413 RepID=A0A5C7HWV3_9ROSI|nr:hypothetical protein EZV62_012522 [Acer yangbiense]
MNGSPHVRQKAKPFFTKLLQNYAATKSLTKVKQLHAIITASGFLSAHLHSIIASAYANSGHVSNARKLFDKIPERNSFLYNTMMRMYTQNGSSYDVVRMFADMLRLENYLPDNYIYTYPIVIKACSDLALRELGVILHGRTMVAGFDTDTFVQNCLLAMYMSFGEIKVARNLFDGMWERSVVSWNTMISGYFKNGYTNQALEVFNWMVNNGVEPDSASVVSVLPACGYLKDVEVGRRVHVLVESKGLGNKIAVWNALVDMYVKCGSVSEARLVFDGMSERDVVTWTSMINGYILNGKVRNALGLLRSMQFKGVRANAVTIASLLSACSSLYYLKDGRCLHGWTIRQKLESEVVVETALIDMYAQCNHVEVSLQVCSLVGYFTKCEFVYHHQISSGPERRDTQDSAAGTGAGGGKWQDNFSFKSSRQGGGRYSAGGCGRPFEGANKSVTRTRRILREGIYRQGIPDGVIELHGQSP